MSGSEIADAGGDGAYLCFCSSVFAASSGFVFVSETVVFFVTLTPPAALSSVAFVKKGPGLFHFASRLSTTSATPSSTLENY